MTDREQTMAFHSDLTKLVQRYCDEFDLTVAVAVGVLQVKCFELWKQADEQCNDQESGDPFPDDE